MVEAIEKDILKPLKAERFMCEIKNYFDSAKGTYLYDVCISEHMKKAGISESDYGLWLKKLLEYLTDKYSLRGENILDFGCGTGELTVWMNCLGYNAVGVDIHEQFLKYAKILATENGLSEKIFIHTTDKRLPFPDGSMDIVTMFSVLEHVSDKTLINNVIPELKRICRGIIYVLVPNKLKNSQIKRELILEYQFSF